MRETDTSYMGVDLHADYCKLADAVVVVGDVQLPVHTTDLAKHSNLLLDAVIAHREQPGTGPVILKELFVGKSLEGVKTLLRCCYQPQRVGQILEEALEQDPAGLAVRDALRVAHMTKSEQLCADMVAFIASRVETLKPPLIPWMEAAEECEAQGLLRQLVQQFAAMLAVGSESHAAQYVEGMSCLNKETAVAILVEAQQLQKTWAARRVMSHKRKADEAAAKLEERAAQAERSVRQKTAELEEREQVMILDESIKKQVVEWNTYALLSGAEETTSPTFHVDGYCWQLRLTQVDGLSPYMDLCLDVKLPNPFRRVLASVTAELRSWQADIPSIKQSEVVIFQGNDRSEFHYSSEPVWASHELRLFLSKRTLLDGALGYLSNGKLKLVVMVEVLEGYYHSNRSSPEPSMDQADSEGHEDEDQQQDDWDEEGEQGEEEQEEDD